MTSDVQDGGHNVISRRKVLSSGEFRLNYIDQMLIKCL